MGLNLHKKMTFEDKFARRYYCKNARRNYTRFAKRYNRRKFRRANKCAVKEERGLFYEQTAIKRCRDYEG